MTDYAYANADARISRLIKMHLGLTSPDPWRLLKIGWGFHK